MADRRSEAGVLVDEGALWRLAGALAGSVTPFDVADALAQDGGSAAEGSFSNMAVLDPVSGRVRVAHRFAGRTEWRTYDLAERVPACDVIRDGQTVVLASPDEIGRGYPELLAEIQAAGISARVSAPLRSADGTVLGAVGFGWSTPQEFGTAQLRRVDLIAQLTGLALERAIGQTSGSWEQPRLEDALETMPGGFLSMDAEARVTAVNAEGERMLRITRVDLVGRELSQAVPAAAGSELESRLRDAIDSGQPVVFESFYPPLRSWFEVRAWPGRQGLNVYFSNIDDRRAGELERLGALHEIELANSRLSFLATLSADLAGSHTSRAVLTRVCRAVVTELADWCTVVVPEGEELVRIAAAHRDPDLDGLAQRLVGTYPHAFSGPSPGVVVYRSGKPLRLDRLAGEIIVNLDSSGASAAYGRSLQLLGDGPGLITPILSGDQVVAVLTMVRCDGPPFTDTDVATAAEIAARVAIFLEDASDLETQRQIAEALQDAALPRVLPISDDVQIAAGYRAATRGAQVGGDWYDAFELETGRIALVVGDVAGHGVQASALMTQMRNTLRAHLFASLGLSESFNRLSRLLVTQEPDAFATIICAELDPISGELTWASAGHPAPIIVSRDGSSAHLQGRPAPPIGWLHATSSRPQSEHHRALEPGDRLLLFTDGLIERRGVDLAIGLTHLMIHAEQTSDADAEEACETVLEDMAVTTHDDDVCLLIADYKRQRDLDER